MMELGVKLKEARKKEKMTQKELAELLGVYQKDISRWENGEYIPSLEIFAKLCQTLKVSADKMLEIESYDDK